MAICRLCIFHSNITWIFYTKKKFKTKSEAMSFEYFLKKKRSLRNKIIDEKPIQVTYWMNLLQNIDKKYPLFVTLNPEEASIDKDLIFREIMYEHPILDENALKGQSKLENIQGQYNIWYAGAWTKYGFHEDGINSGLEIAKKLGCTGPWVSDNKTIKEKIYSA